jgi:hypothetical protein
VADRWGAATGLAAPLTSGSPQVPQNFSPGSTALPHAGHVAASGVPHSTQNARPALFSVPHLAQRIAGVYVARTVAMAGPEAEARAMRRP